LRSISATSEAEAIGQALHYSLWTAELESIGEKRAGIILICRRARDTCTDHSVRLFRVVDAFDLPVTVWDCDVTDESLGDCQRIRSVAVGKASCFNDDEHLGASTFRGLDPIELRITGSQHLISASILLA
jgi:hypothetical protein